MIRYRKTYEVVGFAYEADLHCLDCAHKRFPELLDDENARVIDREGNEVWPVFLGDISESDCCGDCGRVLGDS